MVTTSCYNCNNLMLGNIVVFKNDFSPKCASHLNYIDVCKYLMQCIHSIETPGEKAESKTESSNEELEPVSHPDQTGFSVTTSKIFFGLPVGFLTSPFFAGIKFFSFAIASNLSLYFFK